MMTEQIPVWASAIGIIVVAVRNELRELNSKRQHKETQEAVANVAVAVNGPLSESLHATAKALSHVATLSGLDEDIIAAMAARRRSEEHDRQNADIAEFRRIREEQMKGKI